MHFRTVFEHNHCTRLIATLFTIVIQFFEAVLVLQKPEASKKQNKQHHVSQIYPNPARTRSDYKKNPVGRFAENKTPPERRHAQTNHQIIFF